MRMVIESWHAANATRYGHVQFMNKSLIQGHDHFRMTRLTLLEQRTLARRRLHRNQPLDTLYDVRCNERHCLAACLTEARVRWNLQLTGVRVMRLLDQSRRQTEFGIQPSAAGCSLL